MVGRIDFQENMSNFRNPGTSGPQTCRLNILKRRDGMSNILRGYPVNSIRPKKG